MWFIYALITTIAWGAADLFYKKGADERDAYSHMKTAMMVGFIMGGHAIATLIITAPGYNPKNLLIYLPVSFMYILSMTVGYYGLRYLELSISSPIQNSSGAVTCILCLVVLGQSLDLLSGIAVILICMGVFTLGLFERLELKKERALMPEADREAERKYRTGIVAFMMPILYCIIDALGTFCDAYYLDDIAATPLVDVTEETFEDVANISYELTFLICAVAILMFLILKQAQLRRVVESEMTAAGEQSGKTDAVAGKQADCAVAGDMTVMPLSGLKSHRHRIIAAALETAGQATYVYALSGNGVVAAPMIASYSIVSLILSRLFLKEKLSKAQYAAVTAVIIGIAVLGVVEGLAE